MSDPNKDPEGIETFHFHQLAEVRDARVLEIGSGDGRLTWRYAAAASQVAAIDLDPSRLALALQNRPDRYTRTVSFLLATSEALPFRNDSFEMVVLAWSL